MLFVFLYCSSTHRDQHVWTLSFPTRRSSDLGGIARSSVVMVRTLRGGRHANPGIASTLSQRSRPADPLEAPIWHHSDMERVMTGACVLVVEDRKSTRLNSSH